MAEPGRAPIDDATLAAVEGAVQAALRRGDEAGLRVLGYGEITLVVGWPAANPEWACKRLPSFPDVAAVERYRDTFDRYLRVLATRGVDPVPSELRVVPGDGVAAYVVQPVLPAGSLGPEVLADARPAPDHPLLRAIVDVVPAVVDERTGIDGQLSNWAWRDGTLAYLDVTTPMLFDGTGTLELDLALFLAAYPTVLRPAIARFVAPSVVGAYRDARHVLCDLAGNLYKEGLAGWVPEAVAAANRRVRPPITVAEVRRGYRSDARLWETMLRLRRLDRWWQRRVRRRPYPFLLPGPITR